MNRSNEVLSTYVGDLIALQRHIFEAADRQSRAERMKAHPRALVAVERIKTVLQSHLAELDSHLAGLGGSVTATLKEAFTTITGLAAGMLDKIRAYGISKDLRDDYTALSLAAISYTMLHTAALGLKQRATAELAERHLRDLTPIIIEISGVIPFVVVQELQEDAHGIDPAAASEALRNTHQAWARESIGKAV